MATGTSAGLLDTPHAQSVFKHAALWRYITVWFPMVARSESGRRGGSAQGRTLYVVDGYAGPGRHSDGTEASADKLMAAAQRAAAPVECWLVERDAKTFASLQAEVARFAGQGVRAFARRGDLRDFLPEVLQRATGSPLMLFLDPCGQLLPFAKLAQLLASDRPRATRPVTELLANFSAEYVRRVGGRWLKDRHQPSGDQLNLSLGGPWWRPIAEATVNDADGWSVALGAIVQGFADRLADQTGMRSVVVPVRRLHHHRQPVYYLVLMTRSGHGQWMFADAAGRARKEWLEAHGPSEVDAEEEGALFPHQETVRGHVNAERSRSQMAIASNLRTLASRVASFQPVEHTLDIYGAELGVATETQVNRALRQLVQDGTLVEVRGGRKPRETTYRAAAAR